MPNMIYWSTAYVFFGTAQFLDIARDHEILCELLFSIMKSNTVKAIYSDFGRDSPFGMLPPIRISDIQSFFIVSWFMGRRIFSLSLIKIVLLSQFDYCTPSWGVGMASSGIIFLEPIWFFLRSHKQCKKKTAIDFGLYRRWCSLVGIHL